MWFICVVFLYCFLAFFSFVLCQNTEDIFPPGSRIALVGDYLIQIGSMHSSGFVRILQHEIHQVAPQVEIHCFSSSNIPVDSTIAEFLGKPSISSGADVNSEVERLMEFAPTHAILLFGAGDAISIVGHPREELMSYTLPNF